MKRVKEYVAILMLLGCSSSSWAQTFPAKHLRVILGIPVGGASDLAVRAVATPMQKTLGQPIVVENRPGANSTIAAGNVLKAEPDGYTYFFGSTALIHHVFNKNGGIDARTDLTPVSNIQTGGYFAIVRSTFPIKTWSELLAYSRANVDKLNFGSASSLNEMIMGVVKSRTGLTFTSIPYKGPPDIITAMLSGQVDFTVNTVGSLIPSVQSGSNLPLFVTGGKRMALLPDVPTLAELGVKDFEVSFNVGLWAPPKTPRSVVNVVNSAAAAATKLPEVVEFYKKLGAEPVGSTPEEQVRTLDNELKFWFEATRLAKYEPQ